MKINFRLKYFSTGNMKHQLITLFIFAVILPVFGISCILAFYTWQRTITHYKDLSSSQERLVHSTIVSTSIHLHSVYESVSSHSGLQELLCEDDTGFDTIKATGEQSTFFDNILENTAMLTSLQLYVPENLMRNVEANKYIIPVTEDLKDSRWYKKSLDISGNFWTSDTRTGQNDINYLELYYCCHIPVPKKNTYAVLVMSVSNDYLRNSISNGNYKIYINVNDEPVFISSDRHYEGSQFPIDAEDEENLPHTGIFTLFGKKAVGSLATASLYHSSDKLHIFVADTSAVKTANHLLIIFTLIMLFTLLVSATINFLYASYFSSRINTLRLAMYKISNNDYEIVDNIRGDDELTATFRDMKIMVKKLKAAEARIYQAQIREQIVENQQQQMELKLLANQINPHFLYNTLESIRMKAFVEGNKDVANAIKLLSKSMRYVLNNTQTSSTTLDKELDYISTYLAIQKLRFGTRINYDIKIDKRLEPSYYHILPVLLQPVVENAISHGLENLEDGGNIILKIHPSKDMSLLHADIFDNGSGMPREKLNDVISHLDTPPENPDEHGIGLYNISNRIHLFYGREYGITIRSKENFGTCVTVTIPLYNIMENEE